MKNRKISLLLVLALVFIMSALICAVTAFAADETDADVNPLSAVATRGDVNEDGSINNVDLILLRRHIAGWTVNINEAAADVSDDGAVNNVDLILLRRYIAGWDIVLPPLGPTHTLVEVAAKEPTCTEEGNIAYWKCTSCCDKKFDSADATNELTDEQIVLATVEHIDKDTNGICDLCQTDLFVRYTISLKTFVSNTYVDVGSIVVIGDAPMTEENIEALNAARYNGYGFKTWYTDTESANVFDATAPITSDMILYGDKGDLAGEKIAWSHDPETKTLTLVGEGEMFDYSYISYVPWNGLDIHKVVIDSRITSIGAYSFCVSALNTSSGIALSGITLHEGITRIGDYAFYGENRFTKVVFPESLEIIGEHAFEACSALTYIDIGGKNLELVENFAFAQCSAVEYVIFNGAIGGSFSVFDGCTKIEHAYFAGNKTQYENVEIPDIGNLQLKLAYLYFYTDYEPHNPGPYWYLNEEGAPAQWCYALYYIPSDGGLFAIAKDYVFVKDNKLTAENIEFRNNIWYNGYQFEGWGSDPFTEGTAIKEDITYTGERGSKVGDGVDYNITGNVLTISGSGKMWDFAVPSATPWNESSNFDANDITEIVIQSTVTYIGDYAFCNFPNLQSVDLQSTVVEMSTKAFYGCSNLKYIYYYGNELQLKNCKGLNDQENVAKLTVYCQEFENENVSFLTGKGIVPTIRYWKEVEVATDVTVKLTWEFDTETGTLTVGGEGVIPNVADDTKTPWVNTFYWIDLEESLDFDAIDVAVKTIVVREGITEIGDNAFAGITSAASIQLPAGLKRISSSAFEGTDFLTKATYDKDGLFITNRILIKVNPEVVTNRVLLPATNTTSILCIADGAFEGCTQVTELRLDKAIQGATRESYSGLDSLEKLFFTGNPNDWKNNPTNGTLPETARVYYLANAGSQILTNNNFKKPGYYWHTLNNPTIEGNRGTTDNNNKDYTVYTPEYVHETGMFGLSNKVEWVMKEDKPTCTTPGVLNYHCPYCGEVVKTEEIPVVAHTYVGGVCTVCNASEETE